jgi:hypothetical protein
MYAIELTMNEIAFIKACVLGVIRRFQASTAEEKEKIKLTAAAAECITRLNEARMDTTDVMFINTCLQKTSDYLVTDKGLLPLQKVEARQTCETIQNKLAGDGVPRSHIVN